jgi:hypothetical protein
MIELIKKLMAMTEDNGCSRDEAMIFAEKVAKLKKQYNISFEEVQREEFEAIGAEVQTGYKRVPLYLELLASELGVCFDCSIIKPRAKKGTFIFVGLENDTILAKHFFVYLSRILIAEAKGRKNKNAYCWGIILEISAKLKPAKDEEIKASTETGLIISKESAIRRYIAKEFGKTTSKSSKISGSQEDVDSGKNRGKDISLGKPVSGNNNPIKSLTH